MRPYRRKQYFVHKKIQSKYFILTILLLAVYTFIVVGAIFAPYIIAMFSDIPAQKKLEAANVLLILHGNIWFSVGATIIFFGAMSIFITHKIAGPVFRMKKVAREIAGGDLNARIKLRNGDDLQDMAEDINYLAAQIESFVSAMKEQDKDLSGYIAKLEKELDINRVDIESVKELLLKLKSNRAVIGNVLDKYKTRAALDEASH